MLLSRVGPRERGPREPDGNLREPWRVRGNFREYWELLGWLPPLHYPPPPSNHPIVLLLTIHHGFSNYSRLQKVGIWAWDDEFWCCFGVGGQSFSNFLASTVTPL